MNHAHSSSCVISLFRIVIFVPPLQPDGPAGSSSLFDSLVQASTTNVAWDVVVDNGESFHATSYKAATNMLHGEYSNGDQDEVSWNLDVL